MCALSHVPLASPFQSKAKLRSQNDYQRSWISIMVFIFYSLFYSSFFFYIIGKPFDNLPILSLFQNEHQLCYCNWIGRQYIAEAATEHTQHTRSNNVAIMLKLWQLYTLTQRSYYAILTLQPCDAAASGKAGGASHYWKELPWEPSGESGQGCTKTGGVQWQPNYAPAAGRYDRSLIAFHVVVSTFMASLPTLLGY